MPTHITVNGLGLTHKSSTGFSKATIPDVCKTPSPAGPVPIPYPNFAMSNTLADGTTTVFAKGGKMIAIKGSQYKMSTGDEPGTVGGVKSNTFKQATDWITYSFDVKMDGQNACRDTDKKFHNNKNTVDVMGNLNPTPPATPFVLNIDCNQKVNKPKAGRPAWTKCQCKQYCAKVAALENDRKNRQGSENPMAKVADANKSPDYNGTKAVFIQNFAEGASDTAQARTKFLHSCAADEWEEKHKCTATPTAESVAGQRGSSPFNADHIVDAGLGGSMTSLDNLALLDSRVNTTTGAAMRAYKPEGKHANSEIQAHTSCECPDGPASAK